LSLAFKTKAFHSPVRFHFLDYLLKHRTKKKIVVKSLGKTIMNISFIFVCIRPVANPDVDTTIFCPSPKCRTSNYRNSNRQHQM
jgi:hypothetical protein